MRANQLANTVSNTSHKNARTSQAPCDVYENAGEYLVRAEVPGVTSEGVHLQLERSELTIEAHRPAHDDDESVVYTRSFELPDTIDRDRIEAKLKHGVLHVHLPKAPHARVRKIEVTAI